jgi:hypothetical protein
MHTKDLARAGETSVRVGPVAAWRELRVFPTPSTPPGVSLIALINATNRLAVITRQPGGNHQPGQFG